MAYLADIYAFIVNNKTIYILVYSGLLLLSGVVAYTVGKFFLTSAVRKAFFSSYKERVPSEQDIRIAKRLASLIPIITSYYLIQIAPGFPQRMAAFADSVCSILLITYLSLLINEVLEAFNLSYSRKTKKKNHSIKGYVQIGKIVVYVVAAILILATVSNRSPIIIISSFGALAAVLMLVFQHTLLSLVANVQITSSDVLRLGDWIEMPNSGINGEVIDIALHTVTLRNWDNTISRVPTKNFITENYTNWQMMFASGGRRIKRQFFIDQSTVTFVSAPLLQTLKGQPALYQQVCELLPEYEIDAVNDKGLIEHEITNLNLFRKYLTVWLKQRGDIRGDMYVVVRTMEPTSQGIPIEIYCFTSSTIWIDYEESQAQIFEYVYAIVRYFHLAVYQQPSGQDLMALSLQRSSGIT